MMMNKKNYRFLGLVSCIKENEKSVDGCDYLIIFFNSHLNFFNIIRRNKANLSSLVYHLPPISLSSACLMQKENFVFLKSKLN